MKKHKLLLIVLLFISSNAFSQIDVIHLIQDENGTPVPLKEVELRIELTDLEGTSTQQSYTETVTGITDSEGYVNLQLGSRDTSNFNSIRDSKFIMRTYFNGELIELSCKLNKSLKSADLLDLLQLNTFNTSKVAIEIDGVDLLDTLRFESLTLKGLYLYNFTGPRIELINNTITEDFSLYYSSLGSFYSQNNQVNRCDIDDLTISKRIQIGMQGIGNGPAMFLYGCDFNIAEGGFSNFIIKGMEEIDISDNSWNFNNGPSYDEALQNEIEAAEVHNLIISFDNLTIDLEDNKLMYFEFNSVQDSGQMEPMFNPVVFSGEIDQLNLRGNTINAPLIFRNLDIEKKLIAKKNSFHAGLGFHESLLPENYLDFDWTQILSNQKFFTVASDSTEEFFYGRLYFANQYQDFANADNFRTLIKQYAGFYEHFKRDGDIVSANKVYMELQDKHTNRYAYMYGENGGLKNWFRWRLMQVLKYYVAYGTDPAKALVISFYIVLIFGLFYFFYPSEWDKTSNKLLIAEIKGTFNKNQKTSLKRGLWLLFLNFINAFTLSINSFVTLGFGTIPTTGLPRYICILQGFFGWFLLGLFSVALINQVLF